NEAVLTSSVSISAERRTSEESSSGVLAPESSSWAAKPNRLRIQFEKLLRPAMIGRKIAVKISCGRANHRATGIARARERFLGTSSPISMDRQVPLTIAIVRGTE